MRTEVAMLSVLMTTVVAGLPTAGHGQCQRPSKAAQVWPSKIAHLAEVRSL